MKVEARVVTTRSGYDIDMARSEGICGGSAMVGMENGADFVSSSFKRFEVRVTLGQMEAAWGHIKHTPYLHGDLRRIGPPTSESGSA